MAHIHPVIDDDKHFIVNPDTRAITFAGETLPTLIQFDHNSERFTFEIPPEIDGHDMTLCNKVQIHFININKDKPEEFNPSIYESTDLGPNEDGDKLIFTWLIDQSATLLAGPLNFALRFMCISEDENEDGEIEVVLDYSWNTHPHEGVSVSNGFDNNEILSNKYYEVVDQWYATIEAAAITARDDALNDIGQVVDHLEDLETAAIGNVSNAQAAAVKSIQNAERAAVDNIDQHADQVMENWSDTKIGTDILSEVTKLRGAVSGLSDSTKCKTGVLYGKHSDESYNTRFMEKYGNKYKSWFLIGPGGGPFIISHTQGAKPMSIKQVLLVDVIGGNGDHQAEDFEFEWLYPVFESDVPSGVTASYSTGVGYIDEIFIQDLSSSKMVEYPVEPVYAIEQGTPYITWKSSYQFNKDGYFPIEFVSPIFLGDKGFRAVRYAAKTDIEWWNKDEDLSIVSDVVIRASYLIIAPTPGTNFTMRQCSANANEFTVNANGIAGISGPVENGLEDTYTIMLDDGTTKSFTVPNGNSAGIRTKVSGEMVRCDDVIDVEHTVRATVRSKNLIPFTLDRGYMSSINNATVTLRGVTYAIGSDGSIECSGTTSITDGGNGFSSFELTKGSAWNALKGGVTYYLGGSNNLLLAYKDPSGTTKYIGGNSSFTWSDDYTFVSLYIQFGSLNVATKVEEEVCPYLCIDDGVSREFVPYVDVDGIIVTRNGKNMIPYPHAYGTGNIAGVTYTVNSNGSVIATGTATDNSIQYMVGQSHMLQLPTGTYTLSGCPAGGGQNTYRVCIKTSDTTPGYYYDTGDGITFTLDEPKHIQIYIYVGIGITVNNLVFKPQLEVGPKATSFEPYTAESYEVDGEGKVYLPARIRSISPTMTLSCDHSGVIIDAEYNVDQTAAYNKISALLTTLLNGGS